MSTPLAGQVAVITGGGRGIGAGIAIQLAAMGATTVITGRSRNTLDDTAETIRNAGGACEPLVSDLRDLRSIEALATRVEQDFGGCDVLVNNAGVMSVLGPLHQLPPESWEDVMNTNLRGVYYCVRAFAPMMVRARKGHIINISSLAGKNPLPNGAAYAASKWGLNGLSYSLAEELRAYNIRVSVVSPGSTISELSQHDGKNQQKMLRPSDVAHVVAMLVTQAPQSFVSEVLLRPTQKP
jgi:NAD(P)-dependent dehydrogenase (short-subunit alcohol dehydrogenase family)